jgi:WD40 repeat protein/serine/threonine protein kinase
MATLPTAALFDVLRSLALVSPTQLAELQASPAAQSDNGEAVAQFLLHKGWLTQFQVARLSAGRASELIHNDYLLIDFLGEGNWGKAFQARHSGNTRQGTLCFPRGGAGIGGSEYFRSAAQILAQLAHPNLVRVGGAAQGPNGPFLIREFVNGLDLERFVLMSGPLSATTACTYIRQAALGLQHIHERGLSRLGLRPADLLLARSDAGSDSETRVKLIPHLPDQFTPTDRQRDLTALGQCLRFALTGRPAADGSSTELERSLAPGVAAIVSRLLSAQSQERFPTAAALAETLEPFASATDDILDVLPALDSVRVLLPDEAPTREWRSPQTAIQPLPAEPLRPHLADPAPPELDSEAPTRAWRSPQAPAERASSATPPIPIAIEAHPASSGSATLPVKVPTRKHRWLLWSALAAVLLLVVGVTLLFMPEGKHDSTLVRGPETTPGATEQPLPSPPTRSQDPPTASEPSPQTKPKPMPTEKERPKPTEKAKPKPTAKEKPPPPEPLPAQKLEPRRFETRGDRMAVSPDGKLLVVAVQPNAVSVQETETGKELRQLRGHKGPVSSFSFSADGKRLLTGANFDKPVMLWDLETGKLLRRFEGTTTRPDSVALSPDGRRAIAGAGWTNAETKEAIDCNVRVWDVDSGEQLRVIEGFSMGVHSVAIAPDSRHALAGCWDGTLRLLDLETGTEVRRFEGHQREVAGIAFLPGGKKALSCGRDRTLRLWDVATGKELRTFRGHNEKVSQLSLSADGSRVLTGGFDKTVRVWDVASGRELYRYGGHTGLVVAVALSPDGRRAYSGGHDKTILIADVPIEK